MLVLHIRKSLQIYLPVRNSSKILRHENIVRIVGNCYIEKMSAILIGLDSLSWKLQWAFTMVMIVVTQMFFLTIVSLKSLYRLCFCKKHLWC